MRAVGVEGSYELRRVDAAGLKRAIHEMRAGDLDGGNITMPHKLAAAGLCDHLLPNAKRAGAVNTIYEENGLTGDLTDTFGIVAAAEHAGVPDDTPVLVLGAGGAAAAALMAVEGRPLRVGARSPREAASLLGKLRIPGEPAGWGQPWPGATVVNATPLGMHGEDLPPGVVENASGIIDLTYGRQQTPAVAKARSMGIPAADGVDVLVFQGARSFELWTGGSAPLAAMEAAARAA